MVWWREIGHLDSRKKRSVLIDLQTLRTYESDGTFLPNMIWIRPDLDGEVCLLRPLIPPCVRMRWISRGKGALSRHAT